jgi:membrane-associated phospholipid phosphatase
VARAWILCIGIALAAFAGFVALGRYVAEHGEPAVYVAWERALFNHSTLLAWWLTWACFPKFLIPICVLLLILAWRFPAWRSRVLWSIVSLLVSWRAADYFQHVFARPRPLAWVVKHETTYSYPSSHGAIAVGFYVLWAVLLYTSDLPRTTRNVAALALLIFVAAICWSRIVLGAHYVTDVLGGALLGLAVAAFTLAILLGISVRGAGGRVSQAAE